MAQCSQGSNNSCLHSVNDASLGVVNEPLSLAVAETGSVPSGNAPGEKKWQARRVRRAKPELKLTPGKGIEDLTCAVEDLVDKIVKDVKVTSHPLVGCNTADSNAVVHMPRRTLSINPSPCYLVCLMKCRVLRWL